MKHVFHDTGRGEAGVKGRAKDCAVRAISIIAERSYAAVREDLQEIQGYDPLKGTFVWAVEKYLKRLGYRYVEVGTNFNRAKLPDKGRLIVSMCGHLTAIIDGVILDCWNPAKTGRRGVIGYWLKGRKNAKP